MFAVIKHIVSILYLGASLVKEICKQVSKLQFFLTHLYPSPSNAYLKHQTKSSKLILSTFVKHKFYTIDGLQNRKLRATVSHWPELFAVIMNAIIIPVVS